MNLATETPVLSGLPRKRSWQQPLRHALKYIVSAAVMWFSLAVAANEQLQQLDDLKAVDVAAFRQQLDALQRQADSFTNADKQYLQLLQGYNLTLSGKLKAAQAHLEAMLQQAGEPEILFRVKALLINVQAVTRDYYSAFSYLQDISRTLPDIQDQRARQHGLSVMAYTYNQLEQYDVAKFYAQTLADSAVSERAKCHANHHLLESLYGLQQWAEFKQRVEPAIQHCLALNERIFANLIRIKQHSYLLQADLPAEAERFYNSYKNELSQAGYPLLVANASALAALGAIAVGDNTRALTLAQSALTQLDETDFSLVLINTYSALYQAYENTADFDNAFQMLKKYSYARQAHSDNRFAQQQAYYLAKAEIAVKNQRIALLDRDNELLSLQQNIYLQKVEQNRLAVMLLLSVLTIASFIAYRGLSGRRRFKKIAEYDQLTGISNRYHFNNQARIALEYCAANAKPVALILFDLDHFKSINDTYGHAAGDWALQAVVKTCRNFMRNNDVFGRIGGEEFAIVLAGCEMDKAILLAEICRDAIATTDTSASGHLFALSASFGVSSSDTSGYLLKQLLSDADNAMYQSKQGGRDRVSAFSR